MWKMQYSNSISLVISVAARRGGQKLVARKKCTSCAKVDVDIEAGQGGKTAKQVSPFASYAEDKVEEKENKI